MEENELKDPEETPEEKQDQPEAEAEEAPAEEKKDEQEAEAEPEKPEKVDKEPEPDEDLREVVKKLERRQMYLQRKLEQAEKRQKATRLMPPEVKSEAAPKADDFEDYEDYEKALQKHQADERVKAELARYIEEQNSRAQANDRELFVSEVINTGREKYADFDQVATATTVPITDMMLEIMQEMENPADIAYYLGKNLAETTAISRMSKTQAARALTRVEFKVAEAIKGANKPAPQPTRKVTQAPPPITPSGSTAVITKDPNKMTQAEYEAWRQSQ